MVLLYGHYVWDLGAGWYIYPRNFNRLFVGLTVSGIHDIRTWNELAQSWWVVLLSAWGFGDAVIVYEAYLLTGCFDDGDDGSYQSFLANFDFDHGESRNRYNLQ